MTSGKACAQNPDSKLPPPFVFFARLLKRRVRWQMSMFGAILSKDAVFFLTTDPVTAPLVEYVECDEVIGGRRRAQRDGEHMAVDKF